MNRGHLAEKPDEPEDDDDDDTAFLIPVDVVIDDSSQTSEEAERTVEERTVPIPTAEPKFNLTQWNK